MISLSTMRTKEQDEGAVTPDDSKPRRGESKPVKVTLPKQAKGRSKGQANIHARIGANIAEGKARKASRAVYYEPRFRFEDFDAELGWSNSGGKD